MATAAWSLERGRALVARHLPGWTFGLDHARERLGACHHATRRITVSAYLVAYLADDEVDQVLLHEIAHGLCDPRAGHGATWLRVARRIGYTGGRVIEVPEARLAARWLGRCAAGHEVYRHRRPSGPVRCAPCVHAHRPGVITWEDRGLGLLARG